MINENNNRFLNRYWLCPRNGESEVKFMTIEYRPADLATNNNTVFHYLYLMNLEVMGTNRVPLCFIQNKNLPGSLDFNVKLILDLYMYH